ncbi:MAG: transporter substrate-binding domain-containing protein [Thermodesulfobacteriota bacterium]
MPKTDKRKGIRFSIRLTVLCVFVVATTLTAAIAIGLQFYFSRSMAVRSALSRCQSAAADTSSYLKTIDANAFQVVRMLSRHPELTRDGWVKPGTLPLFSDVLKNNRIFYAIYIGFANGNFFEVVNLNSSSIARRRLKAAPQDRWVVITVRGSGKERRRQFQYYDAGLRMRASRVEESAYDPRVRPWYTQAGKEGVFKTDPYLFQHLQAPGQSYSIRLPEAKKETDATLTVDITLASLSDFLKTRDLGSQSEVYTYQDGGKLIASNQGGNGRQGLPEAPVLELDGRQKAYLSGAGRIRVSNELDWPPIDYAVSGRPRGYSVDLMRLISRMTGLKIEFVNGYTWEELLDLFKRNEIEILQPIFRSRANEALGILSRPLLNLSYAAVTRPGVPEIRDIDQLTGKTIAIPAGWTIIPLIREQLPGISVLEVRSPRAAINAVVEGSAYASLDAAIILHYTADYYFIEDIAFHENVDVSAGRLPQDLHFLVHKNAGLLAGILDAAIERLEAEGLLGQLEEKWCSAPDDSVHAARQTTVPYAALVAMTKNAQLMDHLTRAVIGGQPMFVYVTRLHQVSGSA